MTHRCGEIGDNPREWELEPMPQTAPIPEPIPVPAQPTRVPEEVPA